MNIWRGTASMAASTLASLTPCLATRTTMALRTASDTSGACRAVAATGIGARASGLADVGTVLCNAFSLATCLIWFCAALRVAVCGVTTVRTGVFKLAENGCERLEVVAGALLFFSTTEESVNGKRLDLPFMPVLSASVQVDRHGSDQSVTAEWKHGPARWHESRYLHQHLWHCLPDQSRTCPCHMDHAFYKPAPTHDACPGESPHKTSAAHKADWEY